MRNVGYTTGTAFVLLAVVGLAFAIGGAAPADDVTAAPGPSLAAVFTSPDTHWTSETYKFAPPRHVGNELGRGYEFPCDFSLGDPAYPRCIWDAKLSEPPDLSQCASLAMTVRLTNAESARFFCFYLKSNGRWYLSKYYDALGEGANAVVLQIADYRQEGTATPCSPESLNHVEEIRVNVFPEEGLQTRPTLVTVTDVRVSLTKIDAYASQPLFVPSEADRDLKRTTRRDAQGRLLESRAIHDMDCKFLTEGADAVLARLERAGLNVYILTAWHGRGAIYHSKTTAVEPRFAGLFQGTADPTADMIREAHAAGIQVLGQFCVAYRGEPDPHPEFPVEGTPMEGGYLHSYDLQDPTYRDFIVKEIVDFASRYEVDGIVLDYIRTVGIPFSKIARESYEKAYGTDLGGAPPTEALGTVFTTEGTRWTSETYPFPTPRYEGEGKGCEFSCDFSLADPDYPRCIWDAELAQPVDLSKAGSIALDVRFTNPESAEFFCLYLRSNGKWHLSQYYDALGEGTNHVAFQLSDYRLDGTAYPCQPESLNRVDAIRVNVFPREGLQTSPTLATVSNVRVTRSKSDELKGIRSPEVEARFLQWQEQAVSDIVRRVSEGVRALRPGLVILVDGHPLVKPQLQDQGRNEWLWVEKGWVDVAYDMDYGWRPSFHAYEEAANATTRPEAFALLLGDYDEEGGKSFPRNPQQLARLVDYTLRKYPDRGTAVFDYCYLTDAQIEALRSGPFAEEAVPSWPQRAR